MNNKFIYIYISVFFYFISTLQLSAQYDAHNLNWNTKAYESLIYNGPEGSMPYKLLMPANYNPSQKYPLVVVLHGRGEGIGACSNPDCALLWGGRMHLDKRGQFPAFVIFPRTHGGDWRTPNLNKVKGIMMSLAKKYKIDLDRIYIHGLSAGGTATWNFIGGNPEIFAAASPSSASGNGAFASKLIFTPIWTATGGKDTNPTPAATLGIIKALEKYGKHPVYTLDPKTQKQKWPAASTTEPIYTLAPNRGHSGWVELFNSPAWLPWMFHQNKRNVIVIGKTQIGSGESTTLGVSPGFLGYEWSNGQKTNQIKVTQPGTYKVRFKRYAYIFGGPTVWSDWSTPVTITKKGIIAQADRNESVATIDSFTLIDADTDHDLKTIHNGEIIYSNDLPTQNLNIRANIAGQSTIVEFNLDGVSYTDNSSPYTIFGDNSGDYFPGLISNGSHKLTATSKYEIGKMSTEKTLTIEFTYIAKTEEKIAATDSIPIEIIQVTLYPNPVQDRLYFTFNEPQKIVSISIYDKFGELIYQSEIPETSELTATDIYVNDLMVSSGIYMIRISSDKISGKYFRILRE